jgi:PAS domain S-box-containing protein
MTLPYLRAGLAHNEHCVWGASTPANLESARAAVAGLPDLAEYVATGQLELLGRAEWYLADAHVDAQKIRARWLGTLDAALAAGRSGLRLVGDEIWYEPSGWESLIKYEDEIAAMLHGRRILALCAYALERTSGGEVLDVIERHQYTLARRQGAWQELAGAELRRAHDEMRVLNDSLEERVAKRTAALTAANAQLAYQAELLASVQDAVIATDAQLRITAWNPAAEQIYGWKAEEVIGRDLSGVLRSDLDAAARQAAFDEALHTGEFRSELVHRHKDGSPLQIESVVHSLRDALGRFTGLVGVNREITERKQTEAALRQQKEILQTIFDHMPMLIAFTDQENRLVLANREWERVYGWTVEEVLRNHIDIFAEAYPDPEALQRVMDFVGGGTGRWDEFETRVRDGRIITTSWAVIPLSDGTTINIGRDITEQKRVEATIAREAARTAVLLRVARTLNAQLELKTVVEAVCAEAARVMQVPIAALLLLNETRDRFEYVSGFGLPAELTAGLEVFPVRLYRDEDGGIRPLVVIDDIASVPDMANAWAFAALDIRSVLAVALFHQGQPLGTLAVTTTHAPRRFDDDDIELVRGLADLSALAIQNARLFQTVSEHRQRLQALSAGLVEAQEVERRHIARELHDEVGQLLTGLQLTLAVTSRGLSGPARAGLDEAQKLVWQLMDRAQELSLDLRPPMLDDLGLIPALLWHFEHYTQQTGVRVRFEHSSASRRFAPEVETTAYRIIQAGLTNVARHAGVREVNVRVWSEGDRLSVQIEDAGAGFDVDAALARGLARGLSGMQERAALVGGQLVIESAPGSGTQITAELPVGIGEAADAEVR